MEGKEFGLLKVLANQISKKRGVALLKDSKPVVFSWF